MRDTSTITQALSAEHVFTNIYEKNVWGGSDSSSGTGSDHYQTRIIARTIPDLVSAFHIETILDLPCGDFHWMSRVDLSGIEYIGADIVKALIRKNRQQHGRPGVSFRRLDLIADKLPCVDLILCRDCLVHLPFADVFAALTNICRSDAEYLLTTTFPDRTANSDISTGDWRPLNLERAPFFLPPPVSIINEGCTEGGGYFRDKSLGLWSVADIASALTLAPGLDSARQCDSTCVQERGTIPGRPPLCVSSREQV